MTDSELRAVEIGARARCGPMFAPAMSTDELARAMGWRVAGANYAPHGVELMNPATGEGTDLDGVARPDRWMRS